MATTPIIILIFRIFICLILKKEINISSFSQDIKLSNILIIACLTWFNYKFISPCISILILNYLSIDNLSSNKQIISRVNSVLSWHPITRKLCISQKINNIFLIRNKLFINKVPLNNNNEKTALISFTWICFLFVLQHFYASLVLCF